MKVFEWCLSLKLPCHEKMILMQLYLYGSQDRFTLAKRCGLKISECNKVLKYMSDNDFITPKYKNSDKNILYGITNLYLIYLEDKPLFPGVLCIKDGDA